jgi:hypothetical protein
LMSFLYLHENRTMKPVEIVLKRGAGGWGKILEGVNLIKIYCKHICKCHNEPHVQLIYANKNHLPFPHSLESQFGHMLNSHTSVLFLDRLLCHHGGGSPHASTTLSQSLTLCDVWHLLEKCYSRRVSLSGELESETCCYTE